MGMDDDGKVEEANGDDVKPVDDSDAVAADEATEEGEPTEEAGAEPEPEPDH